MGNEETLNSLCIKYPDLKHEIIDVYQNIKQIPNALNWLNFALKSKMELRVAEDFFIKIYGS